VALWRRRDFYFHSLNACREVAEIEIPAAQESRFLYFFSSERRPHIICERLIGFFLNFFTPSVFPSLFPSPLCKMDKSPLFFPFYLAVHTNGPYLAAARGSARDRVGHFPPLQILASLLAS